MDTFSFNHLSSQADTEAAPFSESDCFVQNGKFWNKLRAQVVLKSVPLDAFLGHDIFQNFSVVEVMPRSPLGKLTAIPEPLSWI